MVRAGAYRRRPVRTLPPARSAARSPTPPAPAPPARPLGLRPLPLARPQSMSKGSKMLNYINARMRVTIQDA
jgi:hypothetical protein